MAVKKGGLGRGISALIPTDEKNGVKKTVENKDEQKQREKEVDINKIEPNRNQPRKVFDEAALMDLADSIKTYGIIEPIIVKEIDDYYMIIAGERRWRAARIAGLTKLPIIIKDYSEQEVVEISLIENIQREDLNPMEEAETYKRLIDEFNLTQEEIANKVGRNRSTIANSLRLLNLDKRVQEFVVENKISNGHARALLGLVDNDLQFEISEKIIEEDLSVRQTELLVKKLQEDKALDKPKKETKQDKVDIIYRGIEKEFASILGTKVQILNGKKKGKIEIEYYSDEDLDRIFTLIKNKQ